MWIHRKQINHRANSNSQKNFGGNSGKEFISNIGIYRLHESFPYHSQRKNAQNHVLVDAIKDSYTKIRPEATTSDGKTDEIENLECYKGIL